jgi:hypothetical protein
VYDARAGRLTTLTPLPDALGVSAKELEAIIGADLPAGLARGLAVAAAGQGGVELRGLHV